MLIANIIVIRFKNKILTYFKHVKNNFIVIYALSLFQALKEIVQEALNRSPTVRVINRSGMAVPFLSGPFVFKSGTGPLEESLSISDQLDGRLILEKRVGLGSDQI
jgi:hypothetical protein